LGEGENPFTKVRKGEINKAEKGKRGERKKRKIKTRTTKQHARGAARLNVNVK
jgi:hypothetical protein